MEAPTVMDEEPEAVVANGSCTGSSSSRPRAQSCSVASGRMSSASPRPRSRRTSTRRSERKSNHHRTANDGGGEGNSSAVHLSVPASPSSTPRRARRLSPATVEAARLALAARAEYSKRRSSKCLEKAAFLIVTKDDDVKLDALEMAALLSRSRRESSGAQTPGSHRSFGADSTGGGGGAWAQPKRSPSATVSISSESHDSPKRAFGGQGQGQTTGQGHLQKLRLSSLASDAASSSAGAATVPASPMLRIFQGGGGGGGGGGGKSGGRRSSRRSSRASNERRRESSDDDDDDSQIPPKKKTSVASADAEGGSGGEEEKRGSGRASTLKLAIAGAVMLTGTCVFISASVLARGETWTIVGSSVMGIGSLLVLLGICWYLASTQDRVGDGGYPVEIKMVDQSQLARLIRKGARVETVTVQV